MKIRLTVTLLLLVLVLIFAVQNAATVEIRLLFWEISFPRSLLIFMMLLIGMVIGWFVRSMYRLTKSRE